MTHTLTDFDRENMNLFSFLQVMIRNLERDWIYTLKILE